MKYYRINQIAMAVLGALLLFFGARTLINIAYEEHEPEKPGFEVSGSEEHPAGGETKPGGEDLGTLLASADATRGADVFKKCAICHNVDKGGPNMIGPNLYGVLGHKIASHEGYEYSEALKAKSSEDWTYENVNHMIESPKTFAPGTKMELFPGLPDAKQRADVIAFLRTKNDNPPPLPEPKPAATAGGEEKPGGEAAGGGAAGGSEVVALLATADPKQGEADAGLCKVCHKFEKGGAALVGPDLYGVVGRKIASVEGFNYTPALKAHEGVWTYENLDPWLEESASLRTGNDDGLPRRGGCQKARQHHRLPADERRHARSSAGGCRGHTAGCRARGEAGRGRATGAASRDACTSGCRDGARAFRRDTSTSAERPSSCRDARASGCGDGTSSCRDARRRARGGAFEGRASLRQSTSAGRSRGDREGHRGDRGQPAVGVFGRRAALPVAAAAGLSGREARRRRIRRETGAGSAGHDR